MRKKIIAGNWKMNKTVKETNAFLDELMPSLQAVVDKSSVGVVLCVPYTDLWLIGPLLNNSGIQLGAQNVAWADSGAYTGEISADMLIECGVRFVVVGHSERRQFFGETDDSVNKRVVQCIKKALTPIICVGETDTQRTNGQTNTVVETQIKEAFKGIDKISAEKTVVAYEPIWAIGTGKTATEKEANDTIRFIRTTIADIYDKNTADNISILYGGSVNGDNSMALLSQSDIDGALVGGASLKAQEFIKIVSSVK